MDANGTRFHLLLGERDWAACIDAADRRTRLADHFHREPVVCDGTNDVGGFGWDASRSELTLRPCLVRFVASPNDRPPDPGGADRRGAARDRYGNVYVIADSSVEIRIVPAATGTATHFWSPGDGVRCAAAERYAEFRPLEALAPGTSLRFSGLAVTDDHYLVVGVVDPAGWVVFDLHAGGPPRQVCWPNRSATRFAPFDVAARAAGGVWILDRVNRRYWALDRNLDVDDLNPPRTELQPERLDDFQPIGGGVRRTAARSWPRPISLEEFDPIAIEGLPDGSVLILDRASSGLSRVLRDGVDGRFGHPTPLARSGTGGIAERVPIAYDMAFLPAEGRSVTPSASGRLYVALAEGNQALAYDVADRGRDGVTMALAADYFPMRLFGGKGLVAGPPFVYYDFFDNWIPLTVQRRPRYAAAATLVTPQFDGREPGCVWHRLMLDACVPPDAAVSVRSRAADDPRDLALTPWQAEPLPYLRRDGSELPLARPSRSPYDGTRELLFQRARGRYLQIELTLRGNGRVTPRLRALRAYYPRFSYLEQYLPAVYRDDEDSASFLDRFLANIEGFFTTIEDRIAAVQGLFDVGSSPADALDWLAGWFGVALDPSWTDDKRRLFIGHATDFFKQRGTIRGLQNAVRFAIDDGIDPTLFTDASARKRAADRIRIIETFRTRRSTIGGGNGDSIATGPRQERAAKAWRPVHHRQVLNTRYADWLRAAGMDVPRDAEFPIRAPSAESAARLWRQFARDVLGFVPSATSADERAWQAYLARRYTTATALGIAYGVVASSLELPLPDRLPADGAPLDDWYQFESIVMQMRRTANRFSVLLPVPPGSDTDERRLERLALVQRVVDLEKPAHTVFDVKYYWALFRVGDARIGEDTLLDRGGRSPDLLPPLTLGRSHLAESLLAAGHPQNAGDRVIVGRDAIARSHPLETRA
jgi:phage tail-like protein